MVSKTHGARTICTSEDLAGNVRPINMNIKSLLKLGTYSHLAEHQAWLTTRSRGLRMVSSSAGLSVLFAADCGNRYPSLQLAESPESCDWREILLPSQQSQDFKVPRQF
jgi:hypothetical protein